MDISVRVNLVSEVSVTILPLKEQTGFIKVLFKSNSIVLHSHYQLKSKYTRLLFIGLRVKMQGDWKEAEARNLVGLFHTFRYFSKRDCSYKKLKKINVFR